MKYALDPNIEHYCERLSQEEPHYLKALVYDTERQSQYSQMLSGPLIGQLLQTLIRLCQARTVLEIGTFTGYGTLSMAEALPEVGHIITCDVNQTTSAIAAKHIAESPHADKITLKIQPALEVIKDHAEDSFDVIFVDADKEHYPDYFSEGFKRLKNHGFMAFDNALFFGQVLQPHNKQSAAIHKTNELIKAHPQACNVLLPICDGLHLVQKK